MLFGIFPFDGNSLITIGEKNDEIEQKIIKVEHKFPTSIQISSSCRELINGMLEKNQHLRIDIHDKLFQAWYDNK